jgi:peptidoglycan/xylan/chitin deacetylase (PgdA/CDA1 family)
MSIWSILYSLIYLSIVYSGRETITSFNCGGQYVLLTFDDAPRSSSSHSHHIAKLLDILYEKKARATFFIQGSSIESNRDLLLRMKNERHDIASAGYNAGQLHFNILIAIAIAITPQDYCLILHMYDDAI